MILAINLDNKMITRAFGHRIIQIHPKIKTERLTKSKIT